MGLRILLAFDDDSIYSNDFKRQMTLNEVQFDGAVQTYSIFNPSGSPIRVSVSEVSNFLLHTKSDLHRENESPVPDTRPWAISLRCCS